MVNCSMKLGQLQAVNITCLSRSRANHEHKQTNCLLSLVGWERQVISTACNCPCHIEQFII